MKTTFAINKFALEAVTLVASLTGLLFLLLFLTLFDGVSNALAIGEVFSERMTDLVVAFGYSTSEAESQSKIWATAFSILASFGLGLGILVTSLQQPSEKEIKSEKWMGNGKMQTTTKVLGIISFVLSFFGYMLFLTKGKPWQELMTLYFAVQAIVCALLASFVPYLFTMISLHIRDKYGFVIDKFVNSVIQKVESVFDEEAKEITGEENNPKKGKIIDLENKAA